MDRLEQKFALFTKLGALLGPLQRLVDHPDEFDEQEAAQTIARYCAEYPALVAEFGKFSTGQPGHNYLVS